MVVVSGSGSGTGSGSSVDSSSRSSRRKRRSSGNNGSSSSSSSSSTSSSSHHFFDSVSPYRCHTAWECMNIIYFFLRICRVLSLAARARRHCYYTVLNDLENTQMSEDTTSLAHLTASASSRFQRQTLACAWPSQKTEDDGSCVAPPKTSSP